jgi:hypothetical protein
MNMGAQVGCKEICTLTGEPALLLLSTRGRWQRSAGIRL